MSSLQALASTDAITTVDFRISDFRESWLVTYHQQYSWSSTKRSTESPIINSKMTKRQFSSSVSATLGIFQCFFYIAIAFLNWQCNPFSKSYDFSQEQQWKFSTHLKRRLLQVSMLGSQKVHLPCLIFMRSFIFIMNEARF